MVNDVFNKPSFHPGIVEGRMDADYSLAPVKMTEADASAAFSGMAPVGVPGDVGMNRSFKKFFGDGVMV